MPPRISSPRQFDPQKMLDRLAERDEANWQLFDKAFEGVNTTLLSMQDSMRGLQSDIRQGQFSHADIAARMGDLERQVIDTREELQRHKTDAARAAAAGAAQGAARGAVEGAAVATAAAAEITASAARKLNKPQIFVVLACAWVMVLTTIEKGPVVARGAAAFFQGLIHLDASKPPSDPPTLPRAVR